MKNIDFAQKGVKFTFQMIPLQFHYYAFKIHQSTLDIKIGFAYVQTHADAATTQKLVDYLYDHQDQFTEEVLIDYTLDNFLDELAVLVASLTV
jgi:hypothetical protein